MLTPEIYKSMLVAGLMSLGPITLMSRQGERLQVLVELSDKGLLDELTIGRKIDFRPEGSEHEEWMKILTKPVRWREKQVYFLAELTEQDAVDVSNQITGFEF